MTEITLQEVLEAIDSLNRHKAAGADELNNDVLKDMQALLAPILVKICNELLQRKLPLNRL
ncbi:RNA-dependent DNA polymerase [Phytophthora megakarya]|uniref:RNA-dependent DNA polymerase n=1 Tax=Phytophthora megakarya TaxID=4795 RepID=A0A225VSY3_9STRA|nr:RNA-dependent DNA polymerase [Phytophthora megakarya]